MVKIDISICPTAMEFTDGDMYDEDNLLEAIREHAMSTFPDGVQFACLQVGWQQGDEWAYINGDKEAGEEFLQGFFESRGTDEDLFVTEGGE
jgi:hypothetical protein